MRKELGYNYYCDLCEKEFYSLSGSMPSDLSDFKIEFNSSGFSYRTIGHCCKQCLPRTFFTDLPSKEILPKSLFRRMLDIISLKNSP